MKINITYKFPDAIDAALEDAGLKRRTEEWQDAEDAIHEILGSSEYLTVEVDTETREVKFVKHRY